LSLRTLKLVLILVISFFILSAVYIASIIVERQNAPKHVSRYNMSWLASQAVSEFARLEQRLSAFMVPGSGVDKEQVQLRLDVVLNRARLLSESEFSDFLNQNPEQHAIIQRLTGALTAVQPLVENLERPGAAQEVAGILEPLAADLARLASSAYQYSGERDVEDQRELVRLHWMFSSLAAGLIVFGCVLLALLGWHNRLLERTQRELRSLAENHQNMSLKLERTNKALGSAYAELQFRNESLQIQEVELRTQNERFNAALDNMSHGLCMVDSAERIIVYNARFAKLFCIDSTVQPGTTLSSLMVQAKESQWECTAALRQVFTRQQELIRDRRHASFVQELDDGRTFAVLQQPMSGGGWVATYEDITERRRTESQIAYMAHHDALTDLANRVLFRHEMERALASAQRQETTIAILCLDLDRFKDVNDSLGHETGDALLRIVAERLRRCVREVDIVARLGGDEFAVLQSGIRSPEDCSALATRIVDAIGMPYELEGQEIVIGTSIGIALALDKGTAPDQLLKHADLALYRAKSEGRSTFRFFEPEMDAQLKARRAMEADLRKALANREFELVYQPQINIGAGKVGGFEALLRWRHPEHGLVSPADFIPVAEDIGLIVPLGEWVIEQACRDAAAWPEPIMVAVNLSSVQFRHRGLVQSVARALAQSRLAPDRLELEITESVLLQDNDMTTATLHQLRRLGVHIALDDFGTGYSSLSYLRSFPFDKIKIDQSFVREMSSRTDCLAIVQSIASLGASLGMSTVAEGVETEDQFLQIRAAGCTEVQGYYFGRPKSAGDISTKLSMFQQAAAMAAVA